MPLFLPHISLWFSYLLFFSFFSFLFYLFFFLFLLSPFTVHNYCFLYYLPWWDLPFLPINCIWLLMGVLPRLPIGLPAAQPLPLLWMYWLHHSPFLDKIACFVSYLSLFFTSFIWIRIKPLHYLPLWHASSDPNPYLPLLGEMSSQQDISPQKSLSENLKIDPLFLPTTKLHPLNTLTRGPPPMYWLGTNRWCLGPLCILQSI